MVFLILSHLLLDSFAIVFPFFRPFHSPAFFHSFPLLLFSQLFTLLLPDLSFSGGSGPLILVVGVGHSFQGWKVGPSWGLGWHFLFVVEVGTFFSWWRLALPSWSGGLALASWGSPLCFQGGGWPFRLGVGVGPSFSGLVL